uniref:Uncharacterized protein n=1 Tax=Oryza meridionalis TaxID=40149 RepID=A0A0E0EBI8_9ORYZ
MEQKRLRLVGANRDQSAVAAAATQALGRQWRCCAGDFLDAGTTISVPPDPPWEPPPPSSSSDPPREAVAAGGSGRGKPPAPLSPSDPPREAAATAGSGRGKRPAPPVPPDLPAGSRRTPPLSLLFRSRMESCLRRLRAVRERRRGTGDAGEGTWRGASEGWGAGGVAPAVGRGEGRGRGIARREGAEREEKLAVGDDQSLSGDEVVSVSLGSRLIALHLKAIFT